ncbi:hypothetical protein DZD52_08040 [Xanthomonas nasturtii]|uniref:Uncharacterized protein n=1 Tax=Xanthomonas nasturtii TaxID=1843581 RepID=A0A3E1KMP0_9XANT|nr:hypothetical protein DZD52_08040 [Xanthomonas nasturtii]
MDAATGLTWTYLQRVLRWWAGKALQPRHRSTALQVIDAHDAITPKQNNQDLKLKGRLNRRRRIHVALLSASPLHSQLVRAAV